MRIRLVGAFVFVLGVVLLTQNVPLVGYLRNVEEDRQRANLERDAFVIAGRAEELLEADGGPGDPVLQKVVDDYRAAEGHRVVVVDRLGSASVISDETAAAGADYSTRPEIGRALTGQISSGRRESDTLGVELVYVAVPVFSGSDVIGAVRLTSPSSEIDDRVSARVRGILAVVLIALALGVVVALVLAHGISRPLRALQRSTNDLASGDLDTRADATHGPLEIRELATAFNRMSTRLQTLVEEQRAFAGDASHQLRTPLTALRLQVEQALETAETNPSRTRAELERATAEIDRLQHLVEGLLVLARLENATAPRRIVDVSTLVRERVDVWSSLAEEREGTMTLRAVDELHCDLVPGTLEQVIDNLVDNAIDASDGPPDIEIDLTAPSDEVVVVRIADRGRGLSPDDLTRAFDRFWRSSSNTTTGSGIGLSIVRRLVDVNDGRVSLAARPGGGLVVEVELPRSRS